MEIFLALFSWRCSKSKLSFSMGCNLRSYPTLHVFGTVFLCPCESMLQILFNFSSIWGPDILLWVQARINLSDERRNLKKLKIIIHFDNFSIPTHRLITVLYKLCFSLVKIPKIIQNWGTDGRVVSGHTLSYNSLGQTCVEQNLKAFPPRPIHKRIPKERKREFFLYIKTSDRES